MVTHNIDYYYVRIIMSRSNITTEIYDTY